MMLIPALTSIALATAAAETPDIRTPNADLCGVFFFVHIEADKRDPDAEETRTEDERTISFVYDTGASRTIVDDDAVFEATGTRVPIGRRVNITNVRSGDITFTKFRAKVTDLDHLSTAFGRPIEGILGHDAFSGWKTVMDYDAGTFIIERGNLPTPDGETVFSSKGKDVRPWISIDIAGKKRRVLIDTGSNSGFSLNDLERFRLSSGPVRSGVSTRLNRLEKRYTARIDGPIEAGPLTFEEPVVASTPKNELMGGEVLRYAKLTYDAEKRRVAFEPYDSAPVPAPAPPLRDGLMMKPAGDNFEVTGIIPGFEDNVADIVVGDTVIAINGRPITDRGCRVMDAERPTSRTLTIQRGDDIMERTLNFKPLLD